MNNHHKIDHNIIDFKWSKGIPDYQNERLKIKSINEFKYNDIKSAIDYAIEKGFGKIILNCRYHYVKSFLEAGFLIEGIIDGFFKGEDAFCMSYFINPERKISPKEKEEDEIIEKCRSVVLSKTKDINGFIIRNVTNDDIPQMIELFKTVFKTYPSPVFNPSYLEEVIDTKTHFKVAVLNDKIVSIASAEMDKENLNAEITDCATYPEHRGQGLLTNLINHLEKDLIDMGFYSLYSLSRAINHGINIALKKHGYMYRGRHINNCNICGKYEDMNIWAKPFNS